MLMAYGDFGVLPARRTRLQQRISPRLSPGAEQDVNLNMQNVEALKRAVSALAGKVQSLEKALRVSVDSQKKSLVLVNTLSGNFKALQSDVMKRLTAAVSQIKAMAGAAPSASLFTSSPAGGSRGPAPVDAEIVAEESSPMAEESAPEASPEDVGAEEQSYSDFGGGGYRYNNGFHE